MATAVPLPEEAVPPPPPPHATRVAMAAADKGSAIIRFRRRLRLLLRWRRAWREMVFMGSSPISGVGPCAGLGVRSKSDLFCATISLNGPFAHFYPDHLEMSMGALRKNAPFPRIERGRGGQAPGQRRTLLACAQAVWRCVMAISVFDLFKIGIDNVVALCCEVPKRGLEPPRGISPTRPST